MVSRTIVVENPLGIHARPAALVVRQAARFEADIYFSRDEIQRINGKSIMGVMMLAAEQGAEITIEAEGEDEEEAVDTLSVLLQSNFEERT